MAGDGPSPASPPPGRRFYPRCPLAFDRCREERPERTMNSLDGRVACLAAEAMG